MPVLLLKEAEIERLLPLEEAMEAVELAFRKVGLEEAMNLSRSRAVTDHAQIHIMAATIKGMGAMGAKLYSTSRKNPPQFYIPLFDGKTGLLLSIMQGDRLGRLRTGAATAVATRALSRQDSRSLGLLGTGKQALAQARGIALVRPIDRVTVWSPTAGNREAFGTLLARELPQARVTVASTAREAVSGHDIVTTITSAYDPFVEAEWLEAGMHINACGSNFAGKAELKPEAVKRCDLIVVDHREQALLESGDLEKPLEDKLISWTDIRDLGPLLVGRYSGRENAGQVTLFKSNGLAIQDVACAMRVYRHALAQGIGTTIDF